MAETGIVHVDYQVLQNFMEDVFLACGVAAADAQTAAEILIASDLRGIESHGISRLKPIYYNRLQDGIINAKTQFEVVREGPTTAVIDGHHSLGHVIGKQAMALTIEKAKAYGMGMAAVRNSTHYGIAGYYAEMAADAGMIGITGTNARPSVAPTFSVQNMLGTNPLTFAMPSDEAFPFVLDCATSTAQRGKVEVYERLGHSIPEGWVVGQDGKYRTDTSDILRDFGRGLAALTPVGGISEETGGHKGYGYSTVVEILSAALQSGAFLWALSGEENGKKVRHRLGHFFIAISIEAFTELSSFKKTTGDILRSLRAAQKAPGHDRIFTAGEKEYECTKERRERGIPLNPSLQADIRALRDELALTGYDFPF